MNKHDTIHFWPYIQPALYPQYSPFFFSTSLRNAYVIRYYINHTTITFTHLFKHCTWFIFVLTLVPVLLNSAVLLAPALRPVSNRTLWSRSNQQSHSEASAICSSYYSSPPSPLSSRNRERFHARNIRIIAEYPQSVWAYNYANSLIYTSSLLLYVKYIYIRIFQVLYSHTQ